MHRLFYILTLAVSALFFVLYPHWFAWYFVVLLLLLPPLDLIISLPGMLTRRAALHVPFAIGQNEHGILTTGIFSKMPLPSGTVKLRLKVTHEDKTMHRTLSCAGGRGSSAALVLDTSLSGVTTFELRRLTVSSLIGLFSISLRAGRGAKADVLVLPPPVKPPNIMTPPKAETLRPKPGGGFSEEHDIRPYRPGDPVKSIHWKLSAKHDTLITREPLELPPHSRLVSVSPWRGPKERDLILGRLCWAADWLIQRGFPFYIELEGKGAVTEITERGDLAELLRRALGGADVPAPVSQPSRFTWVLRIDAREISI